MLFSRKTEGKIILLLEVQSSIVRASIFWFRAGKSPSILSTDSRLVPYKPNVDSAYFVKTTMKALSEVIDAALKRFHGFRDAEEWKESIPHKWSEVHYILSSPWVASQARTLSLSFDSETTLTEGKMAGILASERPALAPEDKQPLELIEEKIFDVRLNGYSVSSWRDKKAVDLGVSYAVTVGGSDTIRRFKQACERIVPDGKVRFHSSLLLQYIGLRHIMPDKQSYMLIHVHGELTDVVAIDNGSCVFFGSYPMGVNTIIRKVAAATKTDARVAESLLTMYAAGSLDEAKVRSAEPAMQSLSGGWSAEFDKLFKDNALSATLPREAIIAARSHEDLFFKSFRAAHPEARIEPLSVDEVVPHVTFELTAERMRIVGIYALAVHDLEGASEAVRV